VAFDDRDYQRKGVTVDHLVSETPIKHTSDSVSTGAKQCNLYEASMTACLKGSESSTALSTILPTIECKLERGDFGFAITNASSDAIHVKVALAVEGTTSSVAILQDGKRKKTFSAKLPGRRSYGFSTITALTPMEGYNVRLLCFSLRQANNLELYPAGHFTISAFFIFDIEESEVRNLTPTETHCDYSLTVHLNLQ